MLPPWPVTNVPPNAVILNTIADTILLEQKNVRLYVCGGRGGAMREQRLSPAVKDAGSPLSSGRRASKLVASLSVERPRDPGRSRTLKAAAGARSRHVVNLATYSGIEDRDSNKNGRQISISISSCLSLGSFF